MTNRQAKLRRRQLENIFSKLRRLEGIRRPKGGWIRTIRTALGMTHEDLAKRVGTTRTGIIETEKREAADRVSLSTLRRTAEGLDCDLVVILVPRIPLEEMVRAQAQAKAESQMRRTQNTMALEDQAVDPESYEQMTKDLVDELMHGTPRELWKE